MGIEPNMGLFLQLICFRVGMDHECPHSNGFWINISWFPNIWASPQTALFFGFRQITFSATDVHVFCLEDLKEPENTASSDDHTL